MSWFAVDRKNPRCDWNEQNSPLFVKIPVARVENFFELIFAWAGGMSHRRLVVIGYIEGLSV